MRFSRRWVGVVGLGLILGSPWGTGLGTTPAAALQNAGTQTGTPMPEPPPPRPSLRLRSLIDELTQLALRRNPAGPERAEAVVQIARAEKDLVGEALAELRRAWCYYMIGRVSEALAAMDVADRLCAQLGDTAYQLHYRRVRWFFSRDQPGAEAAAEEVIRMGEREMRRPRAAAFELEFLGNALVEQRPAQAARALDAALRLFRGAGGGETQQLGGILFESARAHDRLGSVSRARALASEALALQERLAPKTVRTLDVLSLLGNLSAQQHDLSAARAYLIRSVALAEEIRPNTVVLASNLHGLAQMEMRLGDLGGAREHYRRAIELYRRAQPDAEAFSHALVEEANLYMQLGKHEEARTRLEEATPLYERRGTEALGITVLYEAWGNYQLSQRNGVEAERYHRRTSELRERFLPGHHGIGQSVANTGEALVLQNRLDEAVTAYARAWEIALQYAREISDVHELEGFGSESDLTAGRYLRLLARRDQARPALLVAEQSRGRSLRFMAADSRTLNTTLGEPARRRLADLRARYEQAEAQLSQAGMELSRAEAVAKQRRGDDIPDFLFDARKRHLEARTAFELARSASEAAWRDVTLATSAAGTIPSAATLDEALRRLPAGTLYACFKSTEEEVVLILAGSPAPLSGAPGAGGKGASPAPRVEVFRTPLHHHALRDRVRQFGNAITNSSGEAAALGEQLFRDLFPGEAARRVLAARRVVISPEGELWNLPFGALVAGRHAGAPRYLGLHLPLAITPSLTFYDAARRLPRASTHAPYPVVLVAGDPLFGPAPEAPVTATAAASRSMLWIDGKPPAALPGTRADAEAVAKLYGGKPLLGASATETEVRNRLPKADIVHLATHGYLSPQWALASGVLLSDVPLPPTPAGAAPAQPDPRNDGALQAWEILSQLKLKAELVVLAACETARGEDLPGEGLVGLTRALQIAGARSIVTSQWRVRDDATRVLMVRFHEGVRAGQPKDEALRRAMATVAGRSGWGHPYYWAGFVLSGDSDALRLPRPSSAKPVVRPGKKKP